MPLDPTETAIAERTLALVDIASPSREEAQAYLYVKEQVPLPLVHDDG